jgi:probable rRNA maturation factor
MISVCLGLVCDPEVSSSLKDDPLDLSLDRLSRLASDALTEGLIYRPKSQEPLKKASLHIGILLTTDDGIAVYNTQYRAKDGPTNVLSFPMAGPDEPYPHFDATHIEANHLEANHLEAAHFDADQLEAPCFPTKLDHSLALGDLIFSIPTILRQAHQGQKSPQAHFDHLMVHGCLHLLHFDHQNDDQAHEMESLEAMILARWGWENPYKDDLVGQEISPQQPSINH